MPTIQTGTVKAQGQQRMNPIVSAAPVLAGKYLVRPLIKMLENGWFACSVSIRSGSGRGTTDKVVRLTRLFRNEAAAARYALAEGLRCLGPAPASSRP